MLVKRNKQIFSWLLALVMLLGVFVPAGQSVSADEGESTKITFVRKDKTETTVEFTDPNAKLGLNGTPAETGAWFFKNYFIGWSDNPDYAKSDEVEKTPNRGHLFLSNSTFGEVKKTIPGQDIKLYAIYANASIRPLFKNTKIRINDNVAPENFVTPGNPKKDKENSDNTIAEYMDNTDYKINKLEAVFKLDPLVSAAVYHGFGGALENGSDWSALSKKTGNVTVVDLHVELDERMVLPEEFDISFHSYTFRPYQVFSAKKTDGNPVGDKEVYPYLSVEQAGDKPKYGVLNRIKDNEPTTTFRTKSYMTDDQGKKIPVHEFVIRTRVRIGYDKWGNKIPATIEQIQSDMILSLAGGNFTVPNKTAKAIAEGKEGPITIRGFIDGSVKGIRINPVKSEVETLTFKMDEKKTPTVPEEKKDVERIGGDDRIDTAGKISGKYFSYADNAIIARKDEFPDALTASVLAKALNAPILLTDTNKLDERVANELKILGVKKAYVIGRENAISEFTETEIRKITGSTERIGGSDRFETSSLVAKKVVSLVGKKGRAVVATGLDFADSLSISPYAAKMGYPILLVKQNKVPDTISKTIKDLSINESYVVGGDSAVSSKLEKELPKLIKRIGGLDRYETSAKIADEFFTTSKKAYVASGQVFADALVIGPVAAGDNSPVLLTMKNELPKAIKENIDRAKYNHIVVVGLENAVSKEVFDKLK